MTQIFLLDDHGSVRRVALVESPPVPVYVERARQRLFRERIGNQWVEAIMVPCVSILNANSIVTATVDLYAQPERSVAVVRDDRYLDRFTPLLSPDDDLYPDATTTFAEGHRHRPVVGQEAHILGMVYLLDLDSILHRAQRRREYVHTGEER